MTSKTVKVFLEGKVLLNNVCQNCTNASWRIYSLPLTPDEKTLQCKCKVLFEVTYPELKISHCDSFADDDID